MQVSLETSLALALIGMFSALLTLFFDRLFKLSQSKQQSYDAALLELIQQRIEPYADLFQELKNLSSIEWKDLSPQNMKHKVEHCKALVHNALYGKVGLIASHETRELMVYIRTICIQMVEELPEEVESFDVDDWLFMCIWALHDALRADLGIVQPWMRSDLDRRVNRVFREKKDVVNFVKKYERYHWEYPSFSGNRERKTS